MKKLLLILSIALSTLAQAKNPVIKPGIEVLRERGFEGLVGRKFYEPADNRQEETLRTRLESLWPKYYPKG